MKNCKLIEMKKWLLDKGLTQRELAKEAGVTPVAIHSFCRGFLSSNKIKEIFLRHGCPTELVERKVA